ncbi:MAG: 7-cyano-7-deazaguanine synthase QueC [Thermodesulfovibrionales bacterium]
MNNNTRKAVVLLSGGVDSSTTAAIARAEGYEIYALSFDYNQRHKRELESAKMVAESLGVKKHLIIKFDLREIGGSALTAEMEVPKARNELSVMRNELEKKSLNSSLITHHSSLIPVTYVPARNTIFLSFALSWAEVIGASEIFIGANAVDYSGYPDCRPEYLKAFEDMANLATKASVEGKIMFRIRAPLLHMTKAEIIKKGVELGLDYSFTWSCYDPQVSHKSQVTSDKLQVTSKEENFTNSLLPCGKCDSCIFRAKGFKEAGIKDPLA